MKSLIISDTHFGNHKKFADYTESGFNSRFLMQLAGLEVVLNVAVEAGVKRVFHLGDVFNFRGKVEPEVVNLLVDRISKYDLKWYVIPGNHDITTEGEFFNTSMLLNDKCNIKVFTKPTIFEDTVVMVPFTKSKIEKHLSVERPQNCVLMLHQSVIGAVYNGTEMKEGVELSYLKRFKAVFCGHIHTAADFGKNVHIVGAPWQLTFGDDTKKRALIVDENFKVVKEVYSDHPAFITVKDAKEVNTKPGLNFYRVQTDVPIKDLPGNAVSQVTVEHKVQTRVTSSDPKVVLSTYCKNQEQPGMLDVGLKLLAEAREILHDND